MKNVIDKNQEQQNTPVQKAQNETSTGGTAQLVDNRSSTVSQRKLQDGMHASTDNSVNPIQRKANKTGLPDNLKSGIENLSGYNMDDVKVHYNSSKPAHLQAHAYAQGSDIHLASGQEKHLPHEAWHVVQQKQGCVKPTMQFKGKTNINDDAGLEKEADVMGEKAVRTTQLKTATSLKKSSGYQTPVSQLLRKSDGAKVGIEIETNLPVAPKNVDIKKALEITKSIGEILNYFENKNTKEPENEYWKRFKKESFLDSDSEGAKDINQQRFIYNNLHALKRSERSLRPVNQRLIYNKWNEANRGLLKRMKMFDAGSQGEIRTYEIYKGKGFDVVVDHTPHLGRLMKEGEVLHHSAVEIVTKPVDNVDEAAIIMIDINKWIDTALANMKENGAHQEVNHQLYNTAELRDGHIFGNIQVNVGLKLQDVLVGHRDNLDTVKTKKERYEKWIDLFSGDAVWDSIMTTSWAHDKGINDSDLTYLKSIAFQYLMTQMNDMFSLSEESKGSTGKNDHSILKKTPIPRQIELSDWRLKGDWKNQKVFRFLIANHIWKYFANQYIEAGFETEEDIVDYKSAIMESSKRIVKNSDTENDPDVRNVHKRKDLVLEDNSYAGVFEIRDIQGTTYGQDQWLDVWKHWLENNANPVPAGIVNNPVAGKRKEKIELPNGASNMEENKEGLKGLGNLLFKNRPKKNL